MDQGPPTAPPRADHVPTASRQRKLYREPEDKKLTGICSGLADYTGIDPGLMRAIVIVLAIVAPIAVLAYIVGIFVIDERPPTVPRTTAPPVDLFERHPWLPVAVIIGAAVIGLDSTWWWFDLPLGAPILIGVGVWLLARNRDGHDEAPPPPPPPPGPPAGPGPFDPSTDEPRTVVHPLAHSPWLSDHNADSLSLGVDTTTENEDAGPRVDQSADLRDAADEAETGRFTATDPRVTGFPPADEGAGPPGGLPPLTPPEWSGPDHAPATPAVGHRPDGDRPTQRLGLIVSALVLVGVGATWLVDSLGAADVDPRDVIAVGLLVAGAGLVVAAWRGRARAALIPIGLLGIGGLMAAEVVDVPLDAGVGDRTVEVTRRSQLDDTHEMFIGELVVDLRNAPLSETRPTAVTAGVGIGELRVVVPRDANVVVDTSVRLGGHAGELDTPNDDGGIMLDERFVLDGTEGGPRLELTLDAGIGEVAVVRG